MSEKKAFYPVTEDPSITNYKKILSKLIDVKNLKKELLLEKNRTDYLQNQLVIAEKFNVESEVHFLKEMQQKEILSNEFKKLIISENEKLVAENKNMDEHKTQSNLRDNFMEKLKQPLKELEKSLGLVQFNEKMLGKLPDESIINAQNATNRIKHLLSEIELSEEIITVNLKPYNLGPMFNRLMLEIKKTHDVNISHKIKEDNYTIPCEAKKFRIAIIFIIESLIENMQKDKNIEIYVNVNSEEKICFEIKSSGKPFPKIVTKSSSKSETMKKSDKSTKLILAQKIIQAHYGEISFSENPTKVTIKIPSIDYLSKNGFLDSYSKIIMPKTDLQTQLS